MIEHKGGIGRRKDVSSLVIELTGCHFMWSNKSCSTNSNIDNRRDGDTDKQKKEGKDLNMYSIEHYNHTDNEGCGVTAALPSQIERGRRALPNPLSEQESIIQSTE